VAVMESLFLQSPDTITVLCTVGVLLVFYVLFSSFANRQIKEPLGPWPLPVIGNWFIFYVKVGLTFYTFFFFFVMAFISAFKEVWTSIYIPLVVVFAGHKTIKQALVHHDAFSETEVPQIIQDLKLTHGKGFDPAQPVNNSVSNIICSIVYGNRFEYDDPIFTSMVERATQNSKPLGCPSMQLYNFFPRLFSWLGVRKQLVQSAFVNLSNMKTLIKDLQDTLNPGMCRGVVDSFLARKIQLEESGNMNSHYHDDNLLVTVSNLFSAGTDTTSSSIRYGLLLMIVLVFHLQERVQEEMNRVVGSRQVWVEDRKNLPYTDAVIHEIQRMSITIPMILHQTPYTFNPAHFLDEDGHFKKRDAFIPFSAGARACAGESLARMELFLFFTSLLQHFSFTPPPGVKEDELNLTQNVGITLSPSPHKRCAISRV
uniref:Uncharacterized protein n=1 Tax=Labrus bergylta TaxID=56723 RepID=A0A3Q3GRX0_9LABR